MSNHDDSNHIWHFVMLEDYVTWTDPEQKPLRIPSIVLACDCGAIKFVKRKDTIYEGFEE